MTTAVTAVIGGLFGCPSPTATSPAHVDATAPAQGDAAVAAALPLVPRPRSVETCAGAFVVPERAFVLPNHPAAYDAANLLGGWLGAKVIDAVDGDLGGVIEVRLDETPKRDPAVSPPTSFETEGYSIDVDRGHAIVRAKDLGGLFYGVQTLAQLAGARTIGRDPPKTKRSIPCVKIEDTPRYPIRAMHLDVARHFFDVATVERYVDIIAFYKFNVFHWHLTDDQGFRLPLRGLETEPHYTREDVARVVATAKRRGITVVPEIEMPGHARAILSKRPELSCTGEKLPVPTTWGVFPDILCAGNPKTFELIDQLLGDVASLFPSNLVHVGGDEAPKDRWNACPKCKAAMAHDHVDAKGLETKLFAHVAATLATHGKRMLAWDDALDALPEGGIAVAWQNAERGAAAARRGRDVILAPSQTTYFNFWQSHTKTEPGHEGYLPWTDVLAFDPMPNQLKPAERSRVLGGEGALWTEYVTTQTNLDTLLAPRVAALGEALWSEPQPATFPARLTAQRPMLDAVAYFVEPPVGLRRQTAFVDTAAVTVAPPPIWTDAVVRYTTDGSEPTAVSTVINGVFALSATTTVSARTFLPNGRASAVVRGVFEKQALLPATVTAATPGVEFDYVEGTFTAVPMDFTAAKLHGRLPALGFDPRFRAESFAVRYRGFVQAKKDGVMRVVARSDDGIIVEIGGRRVVEDDGVHAARDADGDIALAAGLHPITVLYFQGGGGKSLELTCEGAPCTLFAP